MMQQGIGTRVHTGKDLNPERIFRELKVKLLYNYRGYVGKWLEQMTSWQEGPSI